MLISETNETCNSVKILCSKMLKKVFINLVTQAEVDANYNMDMWVKECDKGIVSCFEAKVGHEQTILSASLALPDTSIVNPFHSN